MKHFTWILLLSLFILPSVSNAQQVEAENRVKTPVVTKGYYSIGNNSMKMPRRTWVAADTHAAPSVTKGYYSIDDNREKLPKRMSWFPKHSPKPVVTKGYYSIGDHWKRLNN
jgi:hypothetical protein